LFTCCSITKPHKDHPITSGAGGKGNEEAAAGGGGAPADLVPTTPESRHRDVLAVPLPRRPLFPGGIMPVTVQNPRLIKELMDIKRQG
jgi:hypothetical protein